MTTESLTEPVTVTPAGVDRTAAPQWFELMLVLFVAFSQPILNSLYISVFGLPASPGAHSAMRYISGAIQEVAALLVLWYVLRRTGRTFLDLGIRATRRDFFQALALIATCTVVYYLTAALLQTSHFMLFGGYATLPNYAAVFPATDLFAPLLFCLLNPFFEEIIVRGYLMTELSAMSGSIALTVVASVVIQTSYHLYQGWFAAACLSINFLVLSIYYAKTHRLLPVIIAHAAADLGLVFYLAALKPH
jgi:membrane protease YdiL (CAAX protease family)